MKRLTFMMHVCKLIQEKFNEIKLKKKKKEDEKIEKEKK